MNKREKRIFSELPEWHSGGILVIHYYALIEANITLQHVCMNYSHYKDRLFYFYCVVY